MNNEVILSRPKDSHDILGVFRLATTAAYRDNPPVSGASFLEGLQMWHAEMLRMRPEVNPGKTKLAVNFAGTTQFVLPQQSGYQPGRKWRYCALPGRDLLLND